MSLDPGHYSIEAAIAKFAEAYHDLEKLQQREAEKPAHEALLPHKGDQKTGLIGEYWAIRYAREEFRGGAISFGGHSEKGWDLKVETEGERPHYIQVKTASAFGNGRLSPICKPSRDRAADDGQELPDYWNELWLLWLDFGLKPITLWKLKPEHVDFGSADCIRNKSIRRTPDGPKKGSECFDWDKAEAVTDIRAKLGIA